MGKWMPVVSLCSSFLRQLADAAGRPGEVRLGGRSCQEVGELLLPTGGIVARAAVEEVVAKKVAFPGAADRLEHRGNRFGQSLVLSGGIDARRGCAEGVANAAGVASRAFAQDREVNVFNDLHRWRRHPRRVAVN